MWLLYYNKNAENVKLHFKLMYFSEIAKPKVNKITLFDPTVLLAHAFRSLQIIMQNDYLRIEDMLSLVSHKL